MTVKEIVEKYLIENNFDGLFLEDLCACELNDLIPCNNDNCNCQPGNLLDDNENELIIGIKC